MENIMSGRITYWVAGGLFLAGALGTGFGEAAPVIQQVSLQTMFLGLAGGLYQLLRDAAAQDHQEFLQSRDHVFGLATSHMANKAFDKYAAFCDEYLVEVHRIAGELFREGAGEATLAGAANLVTIQQNYAAWIDRDTRQKLGGFEQQLRSLGATAGFVRATENTNDPGRGAAIKKQHELYKQILNIEQKPDVVKDDEVPVAIDTAIEKVRQLLGTEDLTQLRRRIIKTVAIKSAAKSP